MPWIPNVARWEALELYHAPPGRTGRTLPCGLDRRSGSVRRVVAGSKAAFPTPCLETSLVRFWRVRCLHASIRTRTATDERSDVKALGGRGAPISQPTGPALSGPTPTRWRAESSVPLWTAPGYRSSHLENVRYRATSCTVSVFESRKRGRRVSRGRRYPQSRSCPRRATSPNNRVPGRQGGSRLSRTYHLPHPQPVS